MGRSVGKQTAKPVLSTETEFIVFSRYLFVKLKNSLMQNITDTAWFGRIDVYIRLTQLKQKSKNG